MEEPIIQSFLDYQRGVARVFASESGEAGEQVCGSGFFVSDQYILTCAHVVIQSLKIPPEEYSVVPKQKIWLDFPSLMTGVRYFGEVLIWKPCPILYQNAGYLDDIALLKLDQAIKNAPDMRLRLREDLHNKAFKIWGFPELNGKESNGSIRAEQARNWLQLQVNPIAHPIYGGFSGAPLALEDDGRYSIVGMINAEESNFNPDTQTGGQTGYAIGAKALAEIWLKQGLLISLLDGVDSNVIERAYKTSRRIVWNSSPSSTIEGFVQDLYSMDSEQYQYLKSFIFCLLTQAIISESLKSNLRAYLTQTYSMDKSDIAIECDRLIEERRSKTDPNLKRISKLWLMLAEAGTTDQYQLETVYFIEDAGQRRDSSKKLMVPLHENLQVDNLTERLVPLLSEIMESLPLHDQLWVEVFLPFKSLHLAPDCWMVKDEYEDEPYLLGTKFPVLIRVWERLSYKKPYKESLKWKRIWENKRLDALSSEALMCCALGRSKILVGLDQNECCGFRSTLPLQQHPEKLPSFLMREGVPIAIWTRLALEQCEGQAQYESLLESNLASLPARLRAVRNDGLTKKNHIARQISVLWDDPTTIPDDAPVFSFPSDRQ